MGVAHTYLAAEALRKAAQERGVTIKVETNGAVGVNDELESDEIAAADCIIIAADKGVSMARFVGKRLVTVSAGDAVRNADAVLNKALNSKVPVYRGGNAFRTSDWRELGRETYRHLMNGISYMIPFVVVGGVMIALSLLLAQMGLAQKYCDLLNNIGKEAFVLIYPVLAASIAVSIGDAPAFMPGLMGGYMAQLGTTAGNKLSWVSSGFWGALIAGFAAGLLVRFLNGLGKKIPENLQQVRSSFLTPLLSLLGIAALMALAVNPPLGRFNQKLYRALGFDARRQPSDGGRCAGCADGHRLWRAHQQGRLSDWHAGVGQRPAGYYGGGHDRRHGAAHRRGAGLPAVPAPFHQGGTSHRAAKPADGGILCNRGCTALCAA